MCLIQLGEVFIGSLKYYFGGYIIPFENVGRELRICVLVPALPRYEKNLVGDLVDVVYVVLASCCHSHHKGPYVIC